MLCCCADAEENLKPIKDAVRRLKALVRPHLLLLTVEGSHARTLYWKAIQWDLMTMHVAYRALKTSKDVVGAVSVDYLMFSGHVTLAEHWFRMEVEATRKILRGEGNTEYYRAQAKVQD